MREQQWPDGGGIDKIGRAMAPGSSVSRLGLAWGPRSGGRGSQCFLRI